MLNKGIHFLIKHKVIVLVWIALIIFFGVVTSPFKFGTDIFPSNPVSVDAIPNIGENQQIVFTRWDGQSPQDIEDQISYPLTSSFLGIPGVKSIRSTSMFGFSSVYIIFEDDVEFYWSRTRILEKLNTLPKELLPEGVQPKLGPDATALGQIYWYTLEGRSPEGKVTGGWNLQELRSIQDFYIKNALASTMGVSEVASVGGFVKEYHIDVDPEAMRQYGISLNQVVDAVKKSNKSSGAQTLEINHTEYFVRGLGYVTSTEDIENTSVSVKNFTPVLIKDIAKVSLGPAERRGILDKEGAEVVGGVVTAQYGANPMQVTQNLTAQIDKISKGLPKKTLEDGTISQLTIVPFYDRSVLIHETLDTLGDALLFEIIIAILVVIVMLRSLKASFLVSGLLPLAVLSVFIAMKLANVEANVVALSGIAIAIGTLVDMGIVLAENITRHLRANPEQNVQTTILNASNEVSGALLTAGLTTIVSFIPVFTLTGAEGKLFIPLAFTKTVALCAAIGLALFALPPVAALIMSKKKERSKVPFLSILLIVLGAISLVSGFYLVATFIALFGLLKLLVHYNILDKEFQKYIPYGVMLLFIVTMLTVYWRPLGFSHNLILNGLFVLLLIGLVLLPLMLFITKYEDMLQWVLRNKWISVSIPSFFVILGLGIMLNMGKEFMPSLEEGDFLLMPTSLPHAGVSENQQVLKKLDMAVAAIPEVGNVVGKAGRVESPLDPAPLSMYENLISYKPEYILDPEGTPLRFEVNEEGLFKTKEGNFIASGEDVSQSDLIPDRGGEYYRNWRPHIKNVDDIWQEISKATQLPGVTSAPKLQPIETRLVMLQTGMRAPMGIKVKGQNLKDVEAFALELEKQLKTVDGIIPESVFADRITGKPYILFDIDRQKIARYGLSIEDVQQTLEVAVGGKTLSNSIEGRERYALRVRYPRELRGTPEDLASVYMTLSNGSTIPLTEFVEVKYQRGPQSIKSEDGFLVSYVIFDKKGDISEVTAVEEAKTTLQELENKGELVVPDGVHYVFSGTYENHIHSQKTLQFVVPAVLLLVFVLLYLQFRSVSISFMVFSGVAVAFAGGFIMLWLYGQNWFLDIQMGSVNIRELLNVGTVNLSVAVWVGFIALFGIATDDGVVMATYLNQSFQDKPLNSKDAIRSAVIEAGKRRVKPCLMTTATTILALLPVLTSDGKGANIMIPMAIPALGGMFMALITLFVVPVLYCWQKEVTLNSAKTEL